MKSIKAIVSGRVQGVGFRYFVKRKADDLGIKGYARNLPDGRVEVLMLGEEGRLDLLISHIETGPRYSRVTSVEKETVEILFDQNGFVTG